MWIFVWIWIRIWIWMFDSSKTENEVKKLVWKLDSWRKDRQSLAYAGEDFQTCSWILCMNSCIHLCRLDGFLSIFYHIKFHLAQKRVWKIFKWNVYSTQYLELRTANRWTINWRCFLRFLQTSLKKLLIIKPGRKGEEPVVGKVRRTGEKQFPHIYMIRLSWSVKYFHYKHNKTATLFQLDCISYPLGTGCYKWNFLSGIVFMIARTRWDFYSSSGFV